jgi:hypothetical protein
VVGGIEQDALLATRVVSDPNSAPSAQRTRSARTEFVPKSIPRLKPRSFISGSFQDASRLVDSNASRSCGGNGGVAPAQEHT